MAADTPGCAHLYSWDELGEEYCNQLISEARDDKGVWQRIGSRPNHDWDAWVIANCAAEYKGVKHRPPPEEGQDEEETIEVVQAEMG